MKVHTQLQGVKSIPNCRDQHGQKKRKSIPNSRDEHVQFDRKSSANSRQRRESEMAASLPDSLQEARGTT